VGNLASTRERILDRGLALMSQAGLDGVTLGVLADQVGMSKSGLFAHFHSKEEVQNQPFGAHRGSGRGPCHCAIHECAGRASPVEGFGDALVRLGEARGPAGWMPRGRGLVRIRRRAGPGKRQARPDGSGVGAAC